MGDWKVFFLAEEEMPKTFDALGKDTGGMGCFCPIGIDIYVVTDFIRIDSSSSDLYFVLVFESQALRMAH